MRHCRAMTWRRSGPTSKAPCWRRAWPRPPQPDWDACPFRKKNPPAAHGNIGGSFMIALGRTRRSDATMTLRFLRLHKLATNFTARILRGVNVDVALAVRQVGSLRGGQRRRTRERGSGRFALGRQPDQNAGILALGRR